MSTETKFCTGCQRIRPIEGGIIKPTASSKRWMCLQCVERKSESLYAGGRKTVYRTLPNGVKS
jgi:hypothetical protein